MACHQEERRPDRNNHRLVCRTKPRGRDRGTLKRAKKRGTGGSKEDESREKSISCWKEGSRSKDISFERRGVSSMLPRPEATTKDPSTDTNVAYFFFFLFSLRSLCFLLFSFFPSLLLSPSRSLLLWWNRQAPRFHVVNGRSKEIDGSIEKLHGRSDCIINWDTRYRCSLVCLFLPRPIVPSADTQLPEVLIDSLHESFSCNSNDRSRFNQNRLFNLSYR